MDEKHQLTEEISRINRHLGDLLDTLGSADDEAALGVRDDIRNLSAELREHANEVAILKDGVSHLRDEMKQMTTGIHRLANALGNTQRCIVDLTRALPKALRN